MEFLQTVLLVVLVVVSGAIAQQDPAGAPPTGEQKFEERIAPNVAFWLTHYATTLHTMCSL